PLTARNGKASTHRMQRMHTVPAVSPRWACCAAESAGPLAHKYPQKPICSLAYRCLRGPCFVPSGLAAYVMYVKPCLSSSPFSRSVQCNVVDHPTRNCHTQKQIEP